MQLTEVAAGRGDQANPANRLKVGDVQISGSYGLDEVSAAARVAARISSKDPETSLHCRVGVQRVRVHDLLHSYASLLLLAGEPMLYVKDQFGHSTVQVTVDLYGHVRPGLNRGAVNRLAEATRPGSPSVQQLHSNYTSSVGG
jgi:integrase